MEDMLNCIITTLPRDDDYEEEEQEDEEMEE
jgi:hypothetical protein